MRAKHDRTSIINIYKYTILYSTAEVCVYRFENHRNSMILQKKMDKNMTSERKSKAMWTEAIVGCMNQK